MKIQKLLILPGPNIWSKYPVLEAWVGLRKFQGSGQTLAPDLIDRVTTWLPTLIDEFAHVGEPGEFLERDHAATCVAHVLKHVAIGLQRLAGTNVEFGKACNMSEDGLHRVVVQYRNEQLARACFRAACEMIMAAVFDRPYDVAAGLSKLRFLADRVCLGPSTAAIVAAAEARGIVARRLNAGSLVQLGLGANQRRIWTAETDRTSAVAESIAQDKELTKSLLRSVGVPVPEGRAVDDPADAWAAACEIGLPVVVKPRNANHGRGVFTSLTTRAQVHFAFSAAAREGNGVLVERFVPGNEHRLLVVGEQVIAASCGEAVYIFGDAHRTVAQLIEAQINSDPRRGEYEHCPLSPVELHSDVLVQLERQGYGSDSIPTAGAKVLVQRSDNLSVDVTDEVHPSIAEHAVAAACAVGLDICGIDLVVADVSMPLEGQGGAFLEVNASPGLLMHLNPSLGTPRPVGDAIVKTLFPDGENGRIPIVCVMGASGNTVVTRLIRHLLHLTGRVIGTSCPDGVLVGDRGIGRLCPARDLLLNPLVEAAVFQVSPSDILQEGFPFDRCDVAVVVGHDEFERSRVECSASPEERFAAERCAIGLVLPTGTAVLSADRPQAAELGAHCPGATTFYAGNGKSAAVAEHRASGGRAVFVKNGTIVLADGSRKTALEARVDLSARNDGWKTIEVESILAATAVAWALGLPPETISAGLEALNQGGRGAHVGARRPPLPEVSRHRS
jgi:cyanophycin synthetase